MDSLPQELPDKIINNLPQLDATASSRASRRWRRRTHQRHYYRYFFFHYNVGGHRGVTYSSTSSDYSVYSEPHPLHVRYEHWRNFQFYPHTQLLF